MSDSNNTEDGTPTHKGVLLTKGANIKLGFPDGFLLKFNEDGEVEGGRIELSIGLDMCPYWLEIAFSHLQKGESSHKAIIQAKTDSNKELLADALEENFIAGMQTIMASAIALEAFYAVIKEHVDLPDEMVESLKKTTRHKKIFETIRYCFEVNSKAHEPIREWLEKIYRFRNWAVHPSAKISAPRAHPDLDTSTEWRFVAYHFYNAKEASRFILSMIAQLATKPKRKHNELTKYCEKLKSKLDPLIQRWEKKYGQVIPLESE